MTYQAWDKQESGSATNDIWSKKRCFCFSSWNKRFVPFSGTFLGNQTTSLDQPLSCFRHLFVTDFLFYRSRLRCESFLTTGVALIIQLQNRMWDCFSCFFSKDVQQSCCSAIPMSASFDSWVQSIQSWTYKSFFQLSTSHGKNVAKKSDSHVLNDSLSFVSEAFGSFFSSFCLRS